MTKKKSELNRRGAIAGASGILAASTVPIMSFANEPLNGEQPAEYQGGLTWGDIGMGIANGALGWVGGQIIESIIGSKKVNFEDLLADYLDQIQAVLKQEIQADAVREARADMKTGEDYYRDYMIANNPSYLDKAWDEIAKSKNRLKSLDLAGHHSFILAQGMELAILQEMWRTKPELEVRIKERAVDGADHLKRMHVAWHEWTAARFDAIWIHDGGVVLKDGKGIRKSKKSFRRTKRYMREAIAEEWNKVVYPKQVKRSDEIEQVWRAI